MAETNNNSARKLTIANIDTILMKQIPNTKWHVSEVYKEDIDERNNPMYTFLLRDSPSPQIKANVCTLSINRVIRNSHKIPMWQHIEATLQIGGFNTNKEINKNILIGEINNIDSFLIAIAMFLRIGGIDN